MKPINCLVALLLSGSAFAQTITPHRPISQAVVKDERSEQSAAQTLVARNTIQSGATAFYTAGQSVILQPGFVAQAGSVFRARIDSETALHTAGEESGLVVRAYPNPFAGQTTIDYSSPLEGPKLHTLTDAQGKVIDQYQEQAGPSTGVHQRPFDGHMLPAGVYFYQLQVGSQARTIRLVKKP